MGPLHFLLLLLSATTCCIDSSSSANTLDSAGVVVRILALFSGPANDLGLDHRLGRQVLKLAVARAKQLNPELADVELLVLSDETACDSLNVLPNQVAEQFYLASASCADGPAEVANGTAPGCGPLPRGSTMASRLGPQATILAAGGRRIDAILGPSCDYLVDLIARMAAYWRMPIYTQTSISDRFAQKDIYSTLTRLSLSIDHLTMFLVRLLERFRWRHLAVVVDGSQVENRLLLGNLERTIERLKYSRPIQRKLFPVAAGFAVPGLGPASTTNQTVGRCWPEAEELLEGVWRVARVVLLLLAEPRAVRNLLLCAHQLRMNNGEFTFLGLDLGLRLARGQQQQQAQQESRYGARRQSFDWFVEGDEENNLYARHMFESLMVLSVELPVSDEYNLFVEQTLDMVHAEYGSEVRFERSNVGQVAVALHDSLLLAVEARKRQLGSASLLAPINVTARPSPLAGPFVASEDEYGPADVAGLGAGSSQVAPLMWSERYSQGLIQSMEINANGDQELDYLLSDLEPEMGAMRPVASYLKSTRLIQMLPNTYIHWPSRLDAAGNLLAGSAGNSNNEEPPADEPECGFSGEAERCIDRQNLYAALTISGSVLVLVLAAGGYSLRRYRRIKYQMQLDDYWWRISWVELQFVQANGSLSSSRPASSLVGGGKLRPGRRAGGSIISSVSSQPSLTRRQRQQQLVAATTARRASSTPAGSTSEQALERGSSSTTTPTPATTTTRLVGRRRPAVPKIITTADSSQQLEPSRSSEALATGGTIAGSGHHRRYRHAANSLTFRSEYSTLVRSYGLALCRDELVIVKELNGSQLKVSRELLVELKSIRELIQDNLARFIGLCIEPGHLAVVYEFCSRGSLQELLLNRSIAMDWTLKYSIIGDIVNGLHFVHTTLLDFHGRLKSTNLVLDSRFTVKLTDFSLRHLYDQCQMIESREDDDHDDSDGRELGEPELGLQQPADDQVSLSRPGETETDRQRRLSAAQTVYNMDSVSVRAEKCGSLAAPSRTGQAPGAGLSARLRNRSAARFFWTAPEHLRDRRPYLAGSKRGDVYALGVILYEIFTRREPYHYGTSAAPRWRLIKHERREFERQQQQHQGADRHPAEGPAGRRACSGNWSSSTGVAGRQVRRVHHRLRRSQASVGPSDSVVGAGDGCLPEEEASVARPIDEGQAEGEASTSELELGASLIGPTPVHGAGAGVEEPLDAEEVLEQLRMGLQPEPVRPYLPSHLLQEVSPRLVELMRQCWQEAPGARPTLGQLRNRLRKLTDGATAKNYLDNLLERLQSYASQLERIVDVKSGDISAEKQRTEELLYQLVPKFVADKLKRAEPIVPRAFDCVTIFFSDIVGFEKYAAVMSPGELVDLLNNIYSSFDSIISSFDVTKIETILDQFLVAAGISLDGELLAPDTNATGQVLAGDPLGPGQPPLPEGPSEAAGSDERRARGKRRLLGALGRSVDSKGQQRQTSEEEAASQQQQQVAETTCEPSQFDRAGAEQIGRMALCIRDLVKSFHFRQNLGRSPAAPSAGAGQGSAGSGLVATTFNIRIGIHSGKVCAGIVGVKRPKFCLIGDTVNVASRMHTNSKANRIQISASTRELLKQVPGFSIEPRGRIEVKGKGQMETFWLESSY